MQYYKLTNLIGIRERSGRKSQVLSFGGKRVTLSEAVLRGFGDDALKKLDDGESVADVKAWADAAVARKMG